MHTRTGDSSAMGSGSSVGSVVTVGLGMSPWLSDQIEAPVVCSVEQYAVEPSAVVPVLPTGEQSAPITTAAGAAGGVAVAAAAAVRGGGGGGVKVGVVTVGDFAVGVASGRSARRNSKTATVIAATSRTARIAGTSTPARSRERRCGCCGVAAGDRCVRRSSDGAGLQAVTERPCEVGAPLEPLVRVLRQRLGQHRVECGELVAMRADRPAAEPRGAG